MPEIPEMEVYKRQMSQTIMHRKIMEVIINREKAINIPPAEFVELVNEQLIVFVSRRGKHIIITLGNGYYLVGHLMLGGRIYLAQPGEKIKTGGSVIFRFRDESRLFFINLRLGWLHLYTEEEMNRAFAKLGPEPLGRLFTEEVLRTKLSKKKGAVKPLLTDQEFIAGIGNCYSDEILFEAKIKPDRKANELNGEEVKRLFFAIPKVLKEAIDNGGYMEKPFRLEDDWTGGHNEHLQVYDREGQPCYRCGDLVHLVTLSGKKSYYCPTCQK